MATNQTALLGAMLAMVLLTFAVGARLLACRTREMKQKRVHPQAASTSIQMAARLEDVRAADNFKNLFEVPVLFYALGATALATHHVPGWLALGAWVFVASRVAHSVIHCTYNRVMHRFAAFILGFMWLVALWVAFVWSLAGAGAA